MVRFSAILVLLFTVLTAHAQENRIKIGASLALTGKNVPMGEDQRNALLFAVNRFGGGKYKVIIEDDKCLGADAVSAAQKLVNIDKIHYALGFTCNEALLPAARIYQNGDVTVITSSATTGDAANVGDRIFRLFPSDSFSAIALYSFVKTRHKKLGILTEENEYTELLQRTMEKLNQAAGRPVELVISTIYDNETNLRPALMNLIAKNPDGIFLNALGDGSFVQLVKEMHELHWTKDLYGIYYPASPRIQQLLGKQIESVTFADLPPLDDTLSPRGKELMKEFTARFGEPQSIPLIVPATIEAFRILDAAIQSGKPVPQFLKERKFEGGLLGPFSFDADGAYQGPSFVIRRIVNGKVETLR